MGAKVTITKDVQKHEITLERIVGGSRARVWQCLTVPEYIDKWWGPKEWITETKTLDARVGGVWHFCMRGHGTAVWGLATYEELRAPALMVYTATASNAAAAKIPKQQQRVTISLTEVDGSTTKITICTRFNSAADLESTVQMGMIGGYDEALHKLDMCIKQ
ncbi:MAG TPA: SRPBCC domain-containing protein [Candidatus Saccharimonadales bacterium]|nr:SRPBCC domain-containing protein [Candidatus Saccharimonadales bacterium]